jgi:hypothetical protein
MPLKPLSSSKAKDSREPARVPWWKARPGDIPIEPGQPGYFPPPKGGIKGPRQFTPESSREFATLVIILAEVFQVLAALAGAGLGFVPLWMTGQRLGAFVWALIFGAAFAAVAWLATSIVRLLAHAVIRLADIDQRQRDQFQSRRD